MTMLIYFAFVAASIVLSIYLVFVEMPNATVDVTRNNLFVLRAALFKIAEEGRISFQSRTYQMHRELLNGLIRYSHDISFMHMRYSRLISPKSSVQYSRTMRKTMENDLKAQPAALRKELEKIVESAHTEMVMLMVNRSLFWTLFMRGWWMACVLKGLCADCVKAYKAKKAERMQAVQMRRHVKLKSVTTISHTDTVAVELVPSFKRTRAKMAPTIDRNAWGYVQSGSENMLAAA